jgi:septal ring factor EnvC (AmiA/AmiB activator)
LIRVVSLALAALLAGGGDAAAQAPSEEELQALRGRIERLRKELAAAEGARAEAVDELRESETAISEANRSLRELAAERDRLRGELARITAEAQTVRAALEARQAQLARLVQARYVRRDGGVLQVLLSGDDPQAISRRLVYEHYVSQAQAELIRSARAELARLAELEAAGRAKADERAAVEAKARAERDLLRQKAAERRGVVTRIAGDVRKARRDLDAAQKNEARLARLIQELARAVRPPPRPGAPRPSAPAAPAVGAFGKLKGRLPAPVRGELAVRYGTSQQAASPSQKGVFFRAPEGDEVRAVAAGRVVFADWLRGYGNLLILDHGDDYLSVYANNESVLKRVGDAVHAGDAVATVGASGGNESSGLYFELRHQGRAFDPAPWLRSK